MSPADQQSPLGPDLLADPRVHATDTGYRVEAFDGEWLVDPAGAGLWVAQARHSSKVAHGNVNVLVSAILGGDTLLGGEVTR